MVVVGRAQAPPPWETPPTAKIPPLHPPADPPPELPPPPSRVLTDSWGVGRIRTGCSRPPGCKLCPWISAGFVVFVEICVFFFAVIVYNKKVVMTCNFVFRGKWCKPALAFTANKNYTTFLFFFASVYCEKNYMTVQFLFYTCLPQKKLHILTIFVSHAFTAKKKRITL